MNQAKLIFALDCTSGFKLTFTDVGEGFNDSTLGPQRRNAACAVMDYIASVINLNGKQPRILFKKSNMSNPGETTVLKFVVKRSSSVSVTNIFKKTGSTEVDQNTTNDSVTVITPP